MEFGRAMEYEILCSNGGEVGDSMMIPLPTLSLYIKIILHRIEYQTMGKKKKVKEIELRQRHHMFLTPKVSKRMVGRLFPVASVPGCRDQS